MRAQRHRRLTQLGTGSSNFATDIIIIIIIIIIIFIIIVFVYFRLSNATIHTAAAQLTHEFHRTAKHSVQSSL